MKLAEALSIRAELQTKVAELKERIKAGEAKSTVAKVFGICRATLYQYLKHNQ